MCVCVCVNELSLSDLCERASLYVITSPSIAFRMRRRGIKRMATPKLILEEKKNPHIFVTEIAVLLRMYAISIALAYVYACV